MLIYHQFILKIANPLPYFGVKAIRLCNRHFKQIKMQIDLHQMPSYSNFYMYHQQYYSNIIYHFFLNLDHNLNLMEYKHISFTSND